MSIQIYGSTQHEMYENWYLMNIDKSKVISNVLNLVVVLTWLLVTFSRQTEMWHKLVIKLQ